MTTTTPNTPKEIVTLRSPLTVEALLVTGPEPVKMQSFTGTWVCTSRSGKKVTYKVHAIHQPEDQHLTKCSVIEFNADLIIASQEVE